MSESYKVDGHILDLCWGIDHWPNEIRVAHSLTPNDSRTYVDPVRCRKCKYSSKIGNTSVLVCRLHIESDSYAVKPDDYCSWGVAR